MAPEVALDVSDDFVWEKSGAGPYFGAKLRKLDQLLENIRPLLEQGEVLAGVFSANSLRPMFDIIVVTNARAFAISKSEKPLKIRLSVPGGDVAAAKVANTALSANRLTVWTTDGKAINFGTLMHKSDVGTALRIIENLPNERPPTPTVETISEGYTAPKIMTVASEPTKREPVTPAEIEAFAGGFPLKALDLVEQVMAELQCAEAACEAGEILGEERHIARAMRLADSAGFGNKRKVRNWVERQIHRRVSIERLRKDSKHMGKVVDVEIRSDRLLRGGNCWILDSEVVAAVELDGQVYETSRPTLTRMGVGSVLPGSAVGFGLATAKSKTVDNRSARFIIAHPEWNIAIQIAPESVSNLRPIAAQVNALARRLASRQTKPNQQGGTTDAAKAPSLSERMDNLQRIAEMRDAGVISADEAERLRTEIFES